MRQIRELESGVHGAVGTPGRVVDLLSRGSLKLDQCVYLCLDEADRLLDVGFEETVRQALDFFVSQRQTVLFSATMPEAVRAFAASGLVDPITISVGEIGVASETITQQVELVHRDARYRFVLEALRDRPPPAVVFVSDRLSADACLEYLLIKGVDAAVVHGGLAQEEREEGVQRFRRGELDVLICTDVASKGLDFPDIAHVINIDLPEDLATYIHRIGRTGRQGRPGLATTLVSYVAGYEPLLLDLRAQLIAAGQRVPHFLNALAENQILSSTDSLTGPSGLTACPFCGGAGHDLRSCPRALAQSTRRTAIYGTKGF